MSFSNSRKSFFRTALFEQMPLLGNVLFFSLLINILLLTPTFYMLEVYDRVVNSRNFNTLLWLTILVIGLYVLLEVLEWVRGRVLHLIGSKVDEGLREKLFHAIFAARIDGERVVGMTALNDIKTIREALPSSAVKGFFDAPFALFVLIILLMINPLFAALASVGAFVQVALGFFNERRTHKPLEDAGRFLGGARYYASGAVRNAQVIEAMGMREPIYRRWKNFQEQYLQKQADASDNAGASAAMSKLMQSLLGSLMLGLGGLLALQGVISGSMVIVGSILGGRLLAPLVQVVAGWRMIERFRQAVEKVDNLLVGYPEPEKGMELPAPKGALQVEKVIAGPPGSSVQILMGVDFRLAPGTSLAVMGPSGAGKSTLARLLVGLWPSRSGKVRLDGMDVHTWSKDELGPYIGYLSQDIELYEGTIAENIARFGDIDMVAVEEACRRVGLDEFVVSLPGGYETCIEADGVNFSGGQRQRIALARAIYQNPPFIVLDEPNSSLDEAGDRVLLNLLRELRGEGVTVIIITHRTQVLAVMDHILLLADGMVQTFAPAKEIFAQLKKQRSKTSRPSPPNTGSASVVSVRARGGEVCAAR